MKLCQIPRFSVKKNVLRWKNRGGGILRKLFDKGVAPVWIPLARENLTENIPLAKDHFLIKSPILYPLGKINFPKTYEHLDPKRPFWGVLIKHIPLAKDSGLKSDPWERHIPSKVFTQIATSWFALEF